MKSIPTTAAARAPIFGPLRAVHRTLLRWRIRWARQDLALCEHYIEVEPIRRRWLKSQLEALEIQLMQLR